jgi:hypothetical protein
VTAAGSSVKVEPLVPQECSNRLQLVVTLEGKPLKGAKADFYRSFYPYAIQKRPLFSLIANEAGIATPAKLSSGDYRVYVQSQGIRSAIFDAPPGTWLYLHVHRKHGVSSISADLTEAVQQLKKADADFERQLKELEQTANRERVSAFQGIVVDPSGARIAHVEISVTQSVSGVRTTLLRGSSDPNGQFSDHLNDGRYVAVFSASGFRIAIVPFEIAAAGSERLRVRLDVGAATE